MRANFPGLRATLVALSLIFLPACATVPTPSPKMVQMDFENFSWTSYDGSNFPFNFWLPEKETPDAVVIGVHGLSGAVRDHEQLAKSLQARGVAFYGYELRGQGNDPIKDRVGDIKEAKEWRQDLWVFHRLVSARHPDVPILWLGESLGALIVCNAITLPTEKVVAPAGLVLASPIPAFDGRVALWHRQLLGFGALLGPGKKIPISDWGGADDKDWKMTSSSDHLQQMAQTPWAVNAYTVRFYHVLSVLIGRMMPQAGKIQLPVLLLHAKHDVFANYAAVEKFSRRLPNAKLKTYEKSHHLLFCDVEKDNVISDVVNWVGENPWKVPPVVQ